MFTDLMNFLNELQAWVFDFGTQWEELKTNMLVSLDGASDTITLFAVAFLIVAKVMGFESGTRWIGLILTIWLFIKFFLVVNGVL